jgi:hypothetical protein
MNMNRALALKGLLALMGLYVAYKLGFELWCIAYGLLM